jgi:hypothetical protein
VKQLFNMQLNLGSFTNIRQWTLDWISAARSEHNTVLAVSIWHIWENRNAVRNGEQMPHPGRIVGKIKACCDFIMEHTFEPTQSTRRESISPNPSWTPPPEGLTMMNVDAATFVQSICMGAGNRGLVLLAGCWRFTHVTDAELAEAIAMRFAVSLALQSS